MSKTFPCAVALFLLSSMLPAIAQTQADLRQSSQEQGKPDSIVLETKTGSVMTSTGGAYETAPIGKQLVTGESMMLTDGAKATVVYYYDDGDRKCVEHYRGPNTYVIDDSCKKAAWMTNGSPGKSALVILGAGLIGAAVLESMDKVPPGPISAGAR